MLKPQERQLNKREFLWQLLRYGILIAFAIALIVYMVYIPFDPVLVRCKHFFFYLAGVGYLDGIVLIVLLVMLAYQELVGNKQGPFALLREKMIKLFPHVHADTDTVIGFKLSTFKATHSPEEGLGSSTDEDSRRQDSYYSDKAENEDATTPKRMNPIKPETERKRGIDNEDEEGDSSKNLLLAGDLRTKSKRANSGHQTLSRLNRLKKEGTKLWNKYFSAWWGLFIVMVLANLAMAAFTGVFIYYTHNTVPQIQGTLHLPGLHGPASIVREGNGILHITAENMEDLFFAQGVAMAQERLWQLDFQRAAIKGQLSERVGRAALPIDTTFRTLGLYKAAEQDTIHFSNSSSAWFKAVTAMCKGVNSYMKHNPSSLPLEFRVLGYKPEHFTETDFIAIIKLMSQGLAMNLEQEVARLNVFMKGVSLERMDVLMPDYPPSGPVILSSAEYTSQRASSPQQRETPPVDFSFTEKTSTLKEETPSATESSQTQLLRELLFQSPRASNNWVVSGSRTVTGKPYLCNDPHLGLTAPPVWIMVHLKCTSSNYEVIGATLPSTPGVILGRNNFISWGVTNVGADVMDGYILEEQERNGVKGYWRNGTWEAFTYREEIIKVSGGDDVKVVVEETSYGPVVSQLEDYKPLNPAKIALRWTILEPNDTSLQGLWEVGRASNWREFRAALEPYVGPTLNYVYADTAGNIGYVLAGKIPRRSSIYTGTFPVKSNSSVAEWLGYIPYESSPHVLNPKEGYIVSANNKVTDNGYPFLILNDKDWELPYRAARIVEMILAKDKHTIADMEAIQGDEVSLVVQELRPLLQALHVYVNALPHKHNIDVLAAYWLERLVAWDGNTPPDSHEAAVFEVWFMKLEQLQLPNIRDWYDSGLFLVDIFDQAIYNKTNDENCKLGCVEAAYQIFVQTLESFKKGTTVIVPTWGEIHQVKIKHPLLANSTLGCLYERCGKTGGDLYSPNIGGWNFAKGFDMVAGASYRHIVDMANMERSVWVTPPGQSGNVWSNNFDDMFSDWLHTRYLPMITKGYASHAELTLRPS